MKRILVLIFVLTFCPLLKSQVVFRGNPYGHHGAWLLPNKKMTPGVIRTTSAAEICDKKFRTKPFRKTTEAMKKEVCKEYGATDCPNIHKGEIDHLVPLELGGMDDVKNLWWQPAPQFHVKDSLENAAKKAACRSKDPIPLTQLQKMMQDDWVTEYEMVLKKNTPTK